MRTALNGYETDGCGLRRANPACNPITNLEVSNLVNTNLGSGHFKITWNQNVSGNVTLTGYGNPVNIVGIAGTQSYDLFNITTTTTVCVIPSSASRVSVPIGIVIYGQKSYCGESNNPIPDIDSMIEFFKLNSQFDIIPTIIYDTNLDISELTLYPSNTYFYNPSNVVGQD